MSSQQHIGQTNAGQVVYNTTFSWTVDKLSLKALPGKTYNGKLWIVEYNIGKNTITMAKVWEAIDAKGQSKWSQLWSIDQNYNFIDLISEHLKTL